MKGTRAEHLGAHLIVFALVARAAAAQTPICEPGGCSGEVHGAFLCGYRDVRVEDGTYCVLNNCQKPRVRQLPPEAQPLQPFIRDQTQANSVRLAVEVIAPWNNWANDSSRNPNATPNGTLDVLWFRSGPDYTGPLPPEPWMVVPDTTLSLCGDSRHDLVETGIITSLSCAELHDGPGEYRYSMRAQVCGGPCPPNYYPNCEPFCGRWTDFELNLSPFLASDVNGACPLMADVDPCTASEYHGVDPAGDGMAMAPPGGGPGATARYRAGGVGWPGGPEEREDGTRWQHYSGLPPGWSHDYAMVLVGGRGNGQTFLVTEVGTYRSFWDLDADGRSDLTFPSSDERYLETTPEGIALVDVDGSRHLFSGGRWVGWSDAAGNSKTASYPDDQHMVVTMPDGRSEVFLYELAENPDDPKRLVSITEVGVDGTTSRTWRYGPGMSYIERPDGSRWEFLYDNFGMTRMTLVGTDGSRRVEGAWQYGDFGNVVASWRGAEEIESGTEVFRFQYDQGRNPRQASVTDAYDKTTVYRYSRDASTNVPSTLEIAGGCSSCGAANTRLTYGDASNPLLPTEFRDARGTTTRVTYDARGQVVGVVEALGTSLARTTSFERAGPFPALVTRITSPSSAGPGSRVDSTTYDAAGNPLELRASGAENGAPFSHATALTFNDAGAPLTIDPPGYGNQDVTRFTYDAARGNLVPLERMDPLVGTTVFGYDSLNRTISVVDANGAETTWSYDGLDRVLAIRQLGETTLSDRVTEFEYNPLGDLFRIRLPEGNLIEYGYDAAGRLIAVERKPDEWTPSERSFVSYDRGGAPAGVALQRWNGSAWTTDAFTGFRRSSRCHLDGVLHADGSVTEYAYDCNNNLERIWDPNHPSENRTAQASATLVWDELGRLSSVEEPWEPGGAARTSFLYDLQDHLRQVTDPAGRVTSYVWSDRSLLTEERNDQRGVILYGYDEAGDLISRTDGRGIVASYLRDVLGRLTGIDYPGTEVDSSYEYDLPGIANSKGRLSRIVRGASTLDYRFDRFGRLVQEGAVGYGYDRNGNRREIRYPNGVRASYDFDFADRPTELVVEGPGFEPKTIASAASYFSGGPLRSLALGNGLEEIREFDERYFPTRIEVLRGGSALIDWRYASDRVGNILSITDEAGSGQARLFAYQDYAYFLTSAMGPWGELEWEYDPTGDRRIEGRNGEISEMTESKVEVRGNLHRVRNVTPEGQSWFDAAGNETHVTAGQRKIRIDMGADNRPRRVQIDEEDDLSQTTAIEYDGRGYLSSATLSEPTEGAERARLSVTYSSSGELLHRFSRRLETAGDERDRGTIADDAYVLYFAGRPVVILRPSSANQALYLNTDHLGTPVYASNEQGEQIWASGFEPFGADSGQALALGQFLRFPGQWDDETFVGSGLTYNLHRWYRPDEGRYTQVDPAATSSEPYAYGSNSPIASTDRLGLYASDFHRGLTEFLAILAGFSREEAQLIARSANRPDEDERDPFETFKPLKFPGSYSKAAEYAAARSMRRWHFPLTCGNSGTPSDCRVEPSSSAARTEYLAGIARNDLAAFGEGLHALQDSYSHQGVPAWSYTAPEIGLIACFGHPHSRGGPKSTAADQPDRFPSDALEAAHATFRALLEWQSIRGGLTGRQIAARWEAFARAAPQILEWARIPTAQGRKDWLAERGVRW